MGAAVAVVAHQQKVLGGGLPELRRQLASAGVDDPAWFEVPKSKKAPKRVRQAIDEGAELLLVWGGDGMVQRCIDAIVDHDVTLGILPAGTANLLATNLGIPHELDGALEVALRGRDRPVDVATVNGEHFAVMSGLGFDAQMIEGADSSAKDKLGRLAYVRTGVGAMRSAPVMLRIKVDGTKWFKGEASCVLVGNVGTASGGLVVFSDAELDDGVLEIGVVTAEGAAQWLRVLGRAARKQADQSPFVQTTRGKKVDVRLDKASLYELDGGSRSKVKRLRYGSSTTPSRCGCRHEHRAADPRDVGAQRRRRQGHLAHVWARSADPRRLPAAAVRRRLQPRTVDGLHDQPRGDPGNDRHGRAGTGVRG